MGLYQKHRPKSFKEVVGMQTQVSMLRSLLKSENVPHSILFTGPSGCGKTTLARILARNLDCSANDLQEVNCADFRGIDMVREIRSRMVLSPVGGTSRVWIIDECHKLSNDAQNAFLKILEESPSHVYFFLATTDPGKLLATIKTRCSEIKVNGMVFSEMQELVSKVMEKEGWVISSDVVEKLIERANGSARQALVLLEQVAALKDEEDQMEVLQASQEQMAINLARALFNPSAKWPDIAKILKGLNEEEPESLRWMVLSYARSILLGGGKLQGRAFQIIQSFRDNFYDSKHAGLAAACYEVIHGE